MNNSAKILVVDDNPAIHDILEKLFASRGDPGGSTVILHAENGLVALEVLLDNQDTDVIILDLNMPVMDGFEMLNHIKGDLRFQSIPVCVFSGCKADSTKALKLGASDFVNKPGDFQEIKIRVLNLIESKRQREASEQAKIAFLATISHELRTPMNGVIGLTELLQGTELSADQSEYLDLLEKSSRAMMDMIESVIGFLASENPLHHVPVMPFSLRATMQKTVDAQAARALENCVTLNVVIHSDLPDNLTGLPDKIQQIFGHLLDNAIKFSPSGDVVVRIEPGERDETSVQLCCSVIDTGIGIPPEKQSKIFEPFVQGDSSFTRKFGGLGIGLSVASRVVQMMGGTMCVESNPGGGSTFSFVVRCSLAATSP